MAKEAEKKMTLEGAVVRLEEIIGKMNADISIDDSITLYTEAKKLLDFADKKLQSARLKVEKLGGETTDEQV